MTKIKLVKNLGILSLGLAFFPMPASSQWPTFDVAKVTNAIQEATTTAQGQLELVNSTTSLTSLQQAIGDNVGSLSMFTDAKAQAEKEAKKLEKARKRAERLKKLANDAQQAANDVRTTVSDGVGAATAAYNQAQGMYNDAAAAANGLKDTAGGLIEQGQGYLQQGQGYVQQGQALAGNASGIVQENTPEINMPSGNLSAAPQGRTQNPIQATSSLALTGGQRADEVYTIDEDGFERAEEPLLNEGGEFSEDMWLGDFAPAVDEPVSAAPETANVARRPFAGRTAGMQRGTAPLPANTVGTTLGDAQGNATVTKVKMPVAEPAVKNADIVKTTDSPAAPVVKPERILGRKPFSAPKVGTVTKGVKIENSVEPERRILKTSSLDSSESWQQPMAFAQQSGGGYKTGTTETGKFIFSDEIANKCGINYNDNIDEDKVLACIKTWVNGLNDPDQTVVVNWNNAYQKAVNDHVAADLAGALINKNYSATFEETVAADLENKSSALTSERDEISYFGEVNRVSQEIIIKLLEATASRLITDSVENLKLLSVKDLPDSE